MNDHKPAIPDSDVSANSGGATLLDQILELIGDAEPVGQDERRSRDRFPIYCSMQLTPVDPLGAPRTEEITTIVGKDLSTNGISFSHEFQLQHRRVILSLTHPRVGQFNVEAQIAWTRRLPIGLYETGCRLIRKVPGHNMNGMMSAVEEA